MPTIPDLIKARSDLRAALEALYWGESSFMEAFRRDADAAVSALRKNPGAFGRLNTFVGKQTIQHYRLKAVTSANVVIKPQKASTAKS